VIDGKTFSDADLDVLRWAYKHARELARRMSLYRGEVVAEPLNYLREARRLHARLKDLFQSIPPKLHIQKQIIGPLTSSLNRPAGSIHIQT
jgi:hypothetical protein